MINWKTFKIAVIVLIVVPWLSAVSICQAQSAEPTTVYQYYMRLPNDYFFLTGSQSERRGLLLDCKDSILDNQHDYLYIPGGDGQWAIEMAVFRYKSIDTIVVLSGSYDPNIPSLDFFRYKSNKWINVTKQLMPVRFNSNDNWLLPEHGTTIVAATNSGQTVLKLRWVGGRFVVSYRAY